MGLQNNGKSICTFDGQSTVYNQAGQVVAQSPAYEATVQPVLMAKQAKQPRLKMLTARLLKIAEM